MIISGRGSEIFELYRSADGFVRRLKEKESKKPALCVPPKKYPIWKVMLVFILSMKRLRQLS